MAALHLRIFAIGFALILGIAFLVPWSHMASARPAVADFEPSMSAEAAAAVYLNCSSQLATRPNSLFSFDWASCEQSLWLS
jgi:hypothetical protein